MSTISVQDSSDNVGAIAKMYKDIRAWAAISLLMGGISIFANGIFDPIWGVVMIVVGILSWKNKIPGMYAIYAVVMGWAAIMNASAALSGEKWFWFTLAIMQVIWMISLLRQLRKVRQLPLMELYQAGNWPADLDPPQDEVVIGGRFAAASAILAGSTWILGLISCSIFFLIALMANPAQLSQDTANATSQTITGLAFSGIASVQVLALALAIAALVSKTRRRNLATLALITGAVFLILYLGLAVIGILMMAASNMPSG